MRIESFKCTFTQINSMCDENYESLEERRVYGWTGWSAGYVCHISNWRY